MSRVFAIVILYKPDVNKVIHNLLSIQPQVDQIILVDNQDGQSVTQALPDYSLQQDCHYLNMHSNIGVAGAQNAGIVYAKAQGATHVLLLDQDTQLPKDYVVSSLALESQLRQANLPVGAIGACYTAAHSRLCGRVPYQEVDFMIASGQFIQCEVLNVVGMMNEALFIDGVDDEWSARAKTKGYRLFLNTQVAIQHELGYSRSVLGGLMHLGFHPPFRYYYMFRNYRFLIRQPYLPCRLKWHYWVRLFKLALKALLVSNRGEYWKAIKQGLADSPSLSCTRSSI